MISSQRPWLLYHEAGNLAMFQSLFVTSAVWQFISLFVHDRLRKTPLMLRRTLVRRHWLTLQHTWWVFIERACNDTKYIALILRTKRGENVCTVFYDIKSPLSLISFRSFSVLIAAWSVYTYRVIQKSLRNFLTRLRNNQDRHSRKEHINR